MPCSRPCPLTHLCAAQLGGHVLHLLLQRLQAALGRHTANLQRENKGRQMSTTA